MYRIWEIVKKHKILGIVKGHHNHKYKTECNYCWYQWEKWYNCMARCQYCKPRSRNILDKWEYYELELTWWEYTKIDKEDYEKIRNSCWYKTKRNSVETRIKKLVKLHRLLINAPDGMEVDHIDGNPLNNRKSNLRLCTHRQNSKNLNKVQWKIKLKWVHRSNYKNCYIWQIDFDTKRKTKEFKNKEDAAKWYDKMATELHWEFAKTNAMLWFL